MCIRDRTIIGSKVEAKGGSVNGFEAGSTGIYNFNGDITITGSTVKAVGGEAIAEKDGAYSHGIDAERDINKMCIRDSTESGFAQIFTTELCGKKVLRMCTINPKTTEKDIFDTIQQLDNSISVAKSHQAIA